MLVKLTSVVNFIIIHEAFASSNTLSLNFYFTNNTRMANFTCTLN